MSTTYAAKLEHVRSVADLIGLDDAQRDALPGWDESADPAESCAVRAMRAVSAVAPYAKGCGSVVDDLESVLCDLVGDLRHLADHLGIAWADVERRSGRYHREERLPGTGEERESPAALEVIVVRDPDGPAHIETFLGGEPIDATEFVIDAGAGWEWEDWVEARDANLAAVSPGARAALLGHYDDPPGGNYIEGRDGEPWITAPSG